MVPIRDNNPTTPYVTYGLIAANVLAFIYESNLPPQQLNGFPPSRRSAARTNSQLCWHLRESTGTRVDYADYVPILHCGFAPAGICCFWILATTKTALACKF